MVNMILGNIYSAAKIGCKYAYLREACALCDWPLAPRVTQSQSGLTAVHCTRVSHPERPLLIFIAARRSHGFHFLISSANMVIKRFQCKIMNNINVTKLTL